MYIYTYIYIYIYWGERVSGAFGFPAPKGPGPGGHYFEFGRRFKKSVLVQSDRFNGNVYFSWV